MQWLLSLPAVLVTVIGTLVLSLFLGTVGLLFILLAFVHLFAVIKGGIDQREWRALISLVGIGIGFLWLAFLANRADLPSGIGGTRVPSYASERDTRKNEIAINREKTSMILDNLGGKMEHWIAMAIRGEMLKRLGKIQAERDGGTMDMETYLDTSKVLIDSMGIIELHFGSDSPEGDNLGIGVRAGRSTRGFFTGIGDFFDLAFVQESLYTAPQIGDFKTTFMAFAEDNPDNGVQPRVPDSITDTWRRFRPLALIMVVFLVFAVLVGNSKSKSPQPSETSK